MKNRNFEDLHKMLKRCLAIGCALTVSMLLQIVYVRSLAEESQTAFTNISDLMVAMEEVTVREEPDVKAEVLVSYNVGDIVFVTGISEDGWYTVFYQGKTGYFKGSEAGSVRPYDEVSIDSINQEMNQQGNESLFLGEELIQYEGTKRTSLIWIGVIGLAIIVCFVAAIISSRKKSMEKREKGSIKQGIESEKNINSVILNSELLQQNTDLKIVDLNDISDSNEE